MYLGIFGNDYGFEDQRGVSPTEHEFDHAARHGPGLSMSGMTTNGCEDAKAGAQGQR
ncbi:MAG: hypothetical protein IPN98_16855 [Propionivibrio sp.]|nr:hypothetical protein [Propionivibrio sp.]